MEYRKASEHRFPTAHEVTYRNYSGVTHKFFGMGAVEKKQRDLPAQNYGRASAAVGYPLSRQTMNIYMPQ